MKRAIQLGLDVVAIKETSSFDKKVISQINHVVKNRSIDIIHTHDFRSNIFGLICAKKMHIPLVSTCHGWISNNTKGKIYTALDKYLLRYHDRVIVVSEIMKKHLVKIGVKENKIHVINNALVINDYVINRENNSFRKEFNISSDKRVIANIGRLSPEKKQDSFLKAAKHIAYNNDLVFVLIGVGPEEKRLRQLASDLGINEKVIFTGYRNDMVDIYNGTDLVVQSSITEGMPNIVLESLLMGVPVIATNVGGTSQIVTNGVHGTLIEPENINALKSALTDYIRNIEKYTNMAKSGRDHVIKNFNQDSRVEKLFSVYNRLV
jgi:glycosyltransferase involved in cell wall biosynthesis